VLNGGDQISVASLEIEVIHYGARVPESGETEREIPSSGPAKVARVTLSRAPADMIASATQRRAPKPTDAIDALESAGRLADRMFTMGRADAGRKILSEPLEEILGGARRGELPSPEITDAAGRLAARLAHQTLDARWIDVALELHLIGNRPLRVATLQQIVGFRAKVPGAGDALLPRYYEQLRSFASGFDSEERNLVDRIASLLPGPRED
jgi:hypothetical protein